MSSIDYPNYLWMFPKSILANKRIIPFFLASSASSNIYLSQLTVACWALIYLTDRDQAVGFSASILSWICFIHWNLPPLYPIPSTHLFPVNWLPGSMQWSKIFRDNKQPHGSVLTGDVTPWSEEGTPMPGISDSQEDSGCMGLNTSGQSFQSPSAPACQLSATCSDHPSHAHLSQIYM